MLINNINIKLPNNDCDFQDEKLLKLLLIFFQIYFLT